MSRPQLGLCLMLYVEQLLFDARSFRATALINHSAGSLPLQFFQDLFIPPFASPRFCIDANLHVAQGSHYAISTDDGRSSGTVLGCIGMCTKAYSGSADRSRAGEHIGMSTITIRYPAFEESRIDFGGNVGGESSMSMARNAVSLLDEWPIIPPIAVADEDAGAALGPAYRWRSSG